MIRNDETATTANMGNRHELRLLEKRLPRTKGALEMAYALHVTTKLNAAARIYASMDPLEILCQTPVLAALIPHLGRADAHSLFSSTRRMHATLKSSAELRAAVWRLLVPKKYYCNTWFNISIMMERIVRAGDLPALRVICPGLKQIVVVVDTLNRTVRKLDDLNYWQPLKEALHSAIRESKYEIIQYLVEEKFASIGAKQMELAIHVGNLEMVQYLESNYPAGTSQISTRVGSVNDVPRMTIMDSIDDMSFIRPPLTENHLAIHRWLSR